MGPPPPPSLIKNENRELHSSQHFPKGLFLAKKAMKTEDENGGGKSSSVVSGQTVRFGKSHIKKIKQIALVYFYSMNKRETGHYHNSTLWKFLSGQLYILHIFLRQC